MSKYTIRYKGHRIKIGGGKLVFNTTYNTSTGTTDPSETTDPMLSASVQLTKNGTTSISISTNPSSISTFAYYEYYVNNSSNVKTTTSNLLITDVLKSTFNLNGNTAYTLYVRAVSSQGNRTGYKSTTFTTPADATTVDSITTYTPVVYNSNGTVYWDIFDNDSSVVAYYYVDNNTSNMKTTTYDAMLSVDDITDEFNLDPGSHTLYVKLYRNGSYSNASSPVTFTVAAPSTYDPSKAVDWDIHTFHDIGEVYQSLHKGDKVSFVIRHGERNDNNSSSSEPITERGQVALLCAGRTKLTGNSDFESGITASDFKLFGSHAIRTSHTAILLAKGRGCDTDTLLGQNTINYCKNTAGSTQQSYFNSTSNKIVNIYGEGKSSDTAITDCPKDWLTGDKWNLGTSDWGQVAQKPYQNDYTSQLNNFIDWIVSQSTASINIFGSHDFNMVPTVITTARKGKTNQADFIDPDIMFWSTGHWLAYACGIAVIQRAGDTNHEHLEVVPVRSLTNITGVSGKWTDTEAYRMRHGATSNTGNDGYHPNSCYNYTYDVNGSIQTDVTTYSETLIPHVYDNESSNSGSGSSSSTVTIEYKQVANSYNNLSTTDFNDAQTVYQAVKTSEGDRLMIITRHTERDSSSGKQSGANANGMQLIKNNIYKIKGAPFNDPSTDAYFSTNVKRCVETSYLIGKLRGKSDMTRMGTESNLQSLPGTSNADANATADQNWEAETAVIHNGAVSPYGNSSQYSNIESIKAVPGPHCYFNDRYWSEGASWPDVQNYYKNNQSTCIQKCTESINWLAEASEGHPFTYLTGHDLSVLPFVCFATKNGNMFSTWNNDYDENPTGWIKYCAGIAVIVHKDGSWEPYPVKLFDAGKFT